MVEINGSNVAGGIRVPVRTSGGGLTKSNPLMPNR